MKKILGTGAIIGVGIVAAIGVVAAAMLWYECLHTDYYTMHEYDHYFK